MANKFDNRELSTVSLSLLTPSEKRQLLEQGTNTKTDYPRDTTIHEVFQLQAAKTPHKIAIAYGDKEITYHELNQKSNQFAHYLQEIGVNQETLVALYLDSSPDFIIAILGILKAGGVYLPLEPSIPLSRIESILNDSKTNIVITQKSYLHTLENINYDLNYICMDHTNILEELSNNSPPKFAIKSDNLAYVMYTSGSTGKPKGVSVVHRGVIRLVKNNNYANFTENEVILQLASIGFDAATFEIWQALLNGGKLVLLPEKKTSLQRIGEAIEQYKVTTLWLTSGLFNLIVEDYIDYLKPLKKLLAGGDVLSIPHVKKVLEKLPNCQLINGYGPTENTTFTCCHTITMEDTQKDSIPIGRPIANTQVYILNDQLEIVPIGVIGELYIGGDGLARGYLNQPKLTSKKFIKNPFSNDPNSRLYKTGDRVRWNQQGNIEFLGRIDFQVKIRGYRIELGEIETVLNQYPKVKISKVIARKNSLNDKQLVAYIIPISSETNITQISQEIRKYLQQNLPDYMIPAALIAVKSFPLNANGKIDYNALPEPDFSILQSNYVAPQTPTEEIMAKIWSQVLKIEKIGINDNFFELGGHSLLGTQVISRIREALTIEIPISLLFKHPTIAEISNRINQQKYNNNFLSNEAIKVREKDSLIPISFAQQRLWFIHQLDPNNIAYNLFYQFNIKGLLNINALEKSFAEISKRHEILRTNFVSVNGNPTQTINHDRFNLPIIDLRKFPDIERKREAEKIGKQEAHYHFDLSKDLLFRVKLIRLNSQESKLLFNIHHIIFDGWSLGLLFSELKAFYAAYCQGLNAPLSPLPIQYADFTLWQKNHLTGEILDYQLNYWKKQLDGTLPILELPIDHPRPKIQTYRGATKTFVLSSELTARIKTFSQREKVTLFMTLLAVFKVLLGRYSGQEDIIVGTAIAGRKRPEIENLMGFFVNTLALRSYLSENLSFREFLNKIKQVCLEAYAHQDVPFEQLVQILQPERNLSHSPIFQVMFVLQNTAIEELELSNLIVTPLETSKETSKFDLTLSMEEQQGKLIGEWEYNTDLFNDSTIERMSNHFQILLSAILDHPQENIWQLPLLTESEKKQLLVEWNQTERDYPQDQCIHQLFEQQVIKNPDVIALIFENQQLTYQELNQLSNQLANYIKKLGVSSQQIVGLYLKPSLIRIIALLGIFKAGAVYLPLDPSYPQERLNFMIKDSNVSLILTQASLSSQLSISALPIIELDSTWEIISQESRHNLKTEITPKDLAYIIYTSGSTGKPKGVLVSHQGLSNLATAQIGLFQVQSSSRVLQFASLSFDASIWEIVMALRSGACLYLGTFESLLPGNNLLNFLQENKITHLTLVPSALANLPYTNLPELQVIIVAGEPCRGDLVKTWSAGRQFFNAYGPTETTVCATVFDCQGMEFNQNPPIGRPIANTQIYILDNHLQLLPVGVPGELHIGGVGLAQGYLNREDLTTKKFIPNAFGEGKLYKTGDLGYYLPDGNIQLLGRIDNQVKMRGFRIELGEIEAILNQHSHIQEAKVTTRKEIEDRTILVAYIILKSPISSSSKISQQLRDYLKTCLPDYMIPSAFIILEDFPLTSNGKIDYCSLPQPDFSTFQSNYVAPRTPTEEIIATIWRQVLTIKNIGVNDNFFDVGGYSLLAIRLLSRIEQQFNINISLYTFLNNPTISSLAKLIQQSQGTMPESSVIAIQPKGDKIPLFFINSISYAQKIAFYLDQDQPFYILNIFGITDFLTPKIEQLKIEDIAAKFIEDMERVIPHGPYYLITYCGDLSLTIEMVKQLEKKGVDIPCIFLIDTFWKPEDLGFYLHWQNLRQFGINYLIKKTKYNLSYKKEKLVIFMNKISSKLRFSDKKKLSRYNKDINLLDALTLARNKYIPKPSQVKVILFLSQEYRLLNTSKLNEFLTEEIIVEEIPGYHHTLFQEPYIQKLTRKLQDYLNHNP